ncbi:mitochondrial 18 KDa protein-domain-containing protein [Phellopilus nigrolimitatus]|nr:mitochondrial 18 KDa protein-domain-containing protein [Phellopilus nigrolimitatus]
MCVPRCFRPVLRTEADLRMRARRRAQTSDIGEAFRPVVHPYVVTAAYGVSWAYLAGDVGFETWKARRRGPSPLEACAFTEQQRLALVAVKRGSFQAIASMALPAFTIHTIVKQSARAFKNTFNPRVRAWGPTLTGLAAVPILPFLFDTPVEKATDAAFEWLEHKWYERLAAEKSLKKKEL